jgi:hypothetical protein
MNGESETRRKEVNEQVNLLSFEVVIRGSGYRAAEAVEPRARRGQQEIRITD